MIESKFSQDYEREVLHCLIGDVKFLKEAFSVASPTQFISTTHANALTVIVQAYIRAKAPPSKIGFISTLVDLERISYSAKKADEGALILEPVQKLADYIFSPLGESGDVKASWLTFCKQRECANTLLENLKKLEDGQQDYATTFENIRKVERRLNSTSQGGISFFDELENLPLKFQKSKSKVYTTGFPTLDAKMNGGMSAGTLSTIIAAPKGGKSMSLVNIAHANLMKGANVVFFTCEISQDKTERRLASRMSGISLDDLEKMPNMVAERCAQFYLDKKCNLKIKGYPPGTASCNDFRSYLYWLEGDQGFKPDVLLFDYGDLIKPIDKHTELRHALNAVWTEMRGLTSEFDAGGATASQCTRDAIDKAIIRMRDVAEAIGKVAVSDHIMTVCRTDEEEKEHKARIFFAGSREGESGGIFPVRYDWKHCTMTESKDKIKQSEVFE